MANAFSEDDEPAHDSSATARALEEWRSSTALLRTESIRAPCPTAIRSNAQWPPSSKPWPASSRTPASNPTSTPPFGRSPSSSTNSPRRRNVSSTKTKTGRSVQQQEQDGSEIRSVELEALLSQGQALLDRHQALEQFRDLAASHYEAETGSAWRPRAGSLISHRHMTAAVIDSREFLAARRRSQNELLLPKGPKIAFSGGADYNDHTRIWAALDKIHAKHPDMVLIHGGTSKGAEKIAALWADKRKVSQIAFKPDWANDGKAAPFKRNDRMLEILPAGVVVFPGSGITGNLADKAKKLGIPVFDCR